MCTPLPKKLAKRGKDHAHIVYINKTSMKKSIAAALIFMSATATRFCPKRHQFLPTASMVSDCFLISLTASQGA